MEFNNYEIDHKLISADIELQEIKSEKLNSSGKSFPLLSISVPL